jgi:hypothetical protein
MLFGSNAAGLVLATLLMLTSTGVGVVSIATWTGRQTDLHISHALL